MQRKHSPVTVALTTVTGLGIVVSLFSHGVLDLWSPVVCRHCGTFDINVHKGQLAGNDYYVSVICMNPECLIGEQVIYRGGEVAARTSHPRPQETPRPATNSPDFPIDPCWISGVAESN